MRAELVMGVDDEAIFGGDISNPTWEEYLNNFDESTRPKIVAIRECIERKGLVGVKASTFCNEYSFQLDDGTYIGFSWRAWGDLMQAIVGKREGYMTYYM